MGYLKNLLNEKNIDILVLQETQLPVDIDGELLKVTDYQIELAMASNSVRVVIYIKKTMYHMLENRKK